jgi:hypothetical protein
MIKSAPLGWVPYCSYSKQRLAIAERKEHFDGFLRTSYRFGKDEFSLSFMDIKDRLSGTWRED